MAARRNTGSVTLKDIAQATGFSANTVSRALADKPDISEETKKVIREKASEMGYIANALASFLRSGVSRNIAIIVGDISNPHFSVMVKEMQTLLQRKGYNSIIFNTDEKAAMERQAITTSLSQNVDGIILCPAPGGEENIRFLQMHDKPFVMIGRHFSGQDASYVVCDDVNGGYAATRYLLERGHRNILFLNGPGGISSSAERLKGYRKALEEAGIAWRSELVHTVPLTSGKGTEKMREIFFSPEGLYGGAGIQRYPCMAGGVHSGGIGQKGAAAVLRGRLRQYQVSVSHASDKRFLFQNNDGQKKVWISF